MGKNNPCSEDVCILSILYLRRALPTYASTCCTSELVRQPQAQDPPHPLPSPPPSWEPADAGKSCVRVERSEARRCLEEFNWAVGSSGELISPAESRCSHTALLAPYALVIIHPDLWMEARLQQSGRNNRPGCYQRHLVVPPAPPHLAALTLDLRGEGTARGGFVNH